MPMSMDVVTRELVSLQLQFGNILLLVLASSKTLTTEGLVGVLRTFSFDPFELETLDFAI
ncbi:MAG: hypothetical protein WCP03_04370 [Candidatus Saccharibacteria bacterium]